MSNPFGEGCNAPDAVSGFPSRNSVRGSLCEEVETMRKFAQSFVNFVKDEDGPTAVEYAVMLALIIVVCITAITTLGSNANNTFSYVGTQIAGS